VTASGGSFERGIVLVAMDLIGMLIAALFAFFFTKAVASVASSDGAEAAREVKPLPRRQMVRCGACGVYVLRDRAVSRGGEQFCSSGCADAS
jgi:hypothetical protein